MCQQSSFDPDTTRAIGAAFDDMCRAYVGFDRSGGDRTPE
jgi:hypothetical protein